MAAHDFNKPCSCRECRTKHYEINCPRCSLLHVFDVEQSYKPSSEKGIAGYDFSTPDMPGKDFKCECGHLISDLKFYTSYNKKHTLVRREYIEKKEKARRCTECSKIEGFDRISYPWRDVELIQDGDSLLCQECNAKHVQAQLIDPSSDSEKYEFDLRSLQYKLVRIKRACTLCKKERWLNAENHWKKQCKNCYGKAPTKKKTIKFLF